MKYPPIEIPDEIRRRLVRLAIDGGDHRYWYKIAYAQIVSGAAFMEVSPRYLADLLALFSPRVSVRRSIRFVKWYLDMGDYAPDVTRSVRVAVGHYENTGEIRGPKTRAFAENLKGNLEVVTLDSWMAKAFWVSGRRIGKKYVHGPCCEAIRNLAHELDVKPAECQAMVWAGVVREAGRNVPELLIEDELKSEIPV